MNKILDHLVADVGFQEGAFYKRQTVTHIRFGQLAFAAQRLERRGQTIIQGFKHGRAAGEGQLVRERGYLPGPQRTAGRSTHLEGIQGSQTPENEW